LPTLSSKVYAAASSAAASSSLARRVIVRQRSHEVPQNHHFLSRQWQNYAYLLRTHIFPFEGHLMLDPQNHRLQDNDIVGVFFSVRLSYDEHI
jgi:hypothetical protein